MCVLTLPSGPTALTLAQALPLSMINDLIDIVDVIRGGFGAEGEIERQREKDRERERKRERESVPW